MKTGKFINGFIKLLTFLILLTSFNQCKKSDTEPTGRIHFKCDLASPKSSNSPLSDSTKICSIDNIKWTIEEISVSTEPIVDGNTDDITWTNILTNDQLQNFDQYDFTFDLPAGVYSTLKIKMKNRGIWICSYNDTTYEFEDFNCSSCDPNGESPVNYFYTDGLHYVDNSGVFYIKSPGEKIGGFEIKEGKTTNISWIINLIQLTWFDTNVNGQWDTGIDKLDDWATPSGVETMFDFVVTYE